MRESIPCYLMRNCSSARAPFGMSYSGCAFSLTDSLEIGRVHSLIADNSPICLQLSTEVTAE
jgi:hypothetical protein